MMRSKKRPEARGDASKALHRQPAQVDGENLDQHIADHEHRHREADHRQSHHEAVDPGAVLPRRDHAERHRDHDGKNDGRQRDRDRRLDALADHLQHRHVGDQGHAEIAMQQLADPGEELLRRAARSIRARCGCARAARASHCRRPGSRRDRPASAAAAETRTAPPRPSREWRPVRGEADIRASLSHQRHPASAVRTCVPAAT